MTTGGVVSEFTGTGINFPKGITPGPDGALWFTNAGGNSIGRITTAGVVSDYTNAAISSPQGITTGPDGALWFVNEGTNTIGRVTTAGAFTFHNDEPGYGLGFNPEGITVGPDGALWFTNTVSDSIGRMTTAGVVSNYTGTGINDPEGITTGPDGARGSAIGAITRSGGSPPPGWSPTTPDRASPFRKGSSLPTAPCGSPTSTVTPSGG